MALLYVHVLLNEGWKWRVDILASSLSCGIIEFEPIQISVDGVSSGVRRVLSPAAGTGSSSQLRSPNKIDKL